MKAGEITYRIAEPRDATGMAAVYLAAFPESVRHFFGARAPQRQAVADLLLIPLLAEPGCGWIAETEGEIVGYCLAPAESSRLRRALWRGPLWRMLTRWLRGLYGVPPRALWRLARNAWHMQTQDAYPAEARILSLAVHPRYQGRGIGRELLRRGLAYLERRGAQKIRLEVRPDNVAAIRLYEAFGFQAKGTKRDLQGEWLIMGREAQP